MPWLVGQPWNASGGGDGCISELAIVGSIASATALDQASDVVVDGTVAFVTSFIDDLLSSVDITNPAAMTVISSLVQATAFNNTRALIKDGSTCYVLGTQAATNGNCSVVNVSNPAAMTLTGTIQNSQLFGARGISKGGNLLYVGCENSNRLTVVDVSTPATPAISGSIQDATQLLNARGTVIDGTLCYVVCFGAAGSGRLTIIDVTTPGAMTVVGSLSSTSLNGASCLVKDGDVCYVGTTAGIATVDVTDPTTPTILDTATPGSNTLDIVKVGDICFLAHNVTPIGAVTAVDVSDPSDLLLVSSITSTTQLEGASGIAHQSGWLYATAINDDCLTAIDYACVDCEVSTFGVIDSLVIGGSGTGAAQQVIIDGAVLFVNTLISDTLWAYDIVDPENITLLDSLADGSNLNGTRNMFLDGTVLYVTSDVDNAITSVDVSTPTALAVISKLTDATNLSSAYDVWIDGGVAYVGAQLTDSMVSIDVSNPASMSVLDVLTDATNIALPGGIIVDGNVLFVLTGTSQDRITAIDISNPAAMSVISSLQNTTLLNDPFRLIKDGNYIYVVCPATDRLTIVNASNPAAMTVVGSVSDIRMDSPLDLAKNGNLVYVTGSSANSVSIVNVANPAMPFVIATVIDATNLSSAHRIAVDSSDGFVYATAGATNRLTVLGPDEDCLASGGGGGGSTGWNL